MANVVAGDIGLGRARDHNRVLGRTSVGPAGKRVDVLPEALIRCLNRMAEVDQRVIDERCGARETVQIQAQSAWYGVECQIDFCRVNQNCLRGLQPVRIGHREGNSVSRVAAEVVTARGNRKASRLRARLRQSRMDVPCMEEVDIPCEGARRQRAVFRVGPIASKGDRIPSNEEYSVLRRQDGRHRLVAHTDVDWRRERGIGAIRDRKPGGVGSVVPIRMDRTGFC